MNDINIIILQGRLTAEPELKTTPNGTYVCSFDIAVNKSTGKEKITTYVRCNAWRNTAEFISKYAHKGDKITIKGEITQRKWTKQDGSTVSSMEVLVNEVVGLESRAQKQQEQQQSVPAPTPALAYAGNTDGFEDMPDDDDLPF